MKRDSFSSEEEPRISEDNKPNFSVTNSTSISWASTAYWVLLSAFHIQQIFTEYLLCARSYSSCWGPGSEQNRPQKDHKKKILCSHEAHILLWDTHNKQRRKCQSAKIYTYICISAKGCSDCWMMKSLQFGWCRSKEWERFEGRPEGGRRVVHAEI